MLVIAQLDWREDGFPNTTTYRIVVDIDQDRRDNGCWTAPSVKIERRGKAAAGETVWLPLHSKDDLQHIYECVLARMPLMLSAYRLPSGWKYVEGALHIDCGTFEMEP